MSRGTRVLLPLVINIIIVVMCVRIYLKGYPFIVVLTTFLISLLIGNAAVLLARFIASKRGASGGPRS